MAPPDDIRLSFNEAAEIYDRVRPSYPTELFDDLFDLVPAVPEIIEVGPGTGQATRHLLERGATVHAIEIGPAMAARLGANLESDRLRISVGDFETMSLASASADAVFSATAYHWISPAGQTDRPATVLRSGGLLAVVDLSRSTPMSIEDSSLPVIRSTAASSKAMSGRRPQPEARSTRRSAGRWRPTFGSGRSRSGPTTGTRPTQ